MPLKNDTISKLTIKEHIDMSNHPILNLGFPTTDSCAANKGYVDNVILESKQNSLSVGRGLEVLEDKRVALESPVNVQFGGTGVTSFDAGYVILGNGNHPLTTTSQLRWETQSSTLFVPTINLSVCLTNDLRSKRCSSESVSTVTLGSQKGTFTELLCEKAENTSTVTKSLETGRFVKHYECHSISSDTGVELNPKQILSTLILRTGQNEFQSDKLPSAASVVKEMSKVECGTCFTFYYKNNDSKEISLLNDADENICLIEAGGLVEFTLLFLDTTKDNAKYEVLYKR
jgi:hypothetical protein